MKRNYPSSIFFVLIFFMLICGTVYGQTSIQIMSATVKDKVIPGAQLIFQKNGFASVKAVTDYNGIVSIPSPFGGVDDSSVMLIVKKPGYSNMVVKCPCKDLTYALSTKMRELDGLRVVLSWNRTPKDLDSHMSFPGNHIYYKKKRGTKASLDVDQTKGYGPETITIYKKYHAQKYVYAVHNYTDKRVRNGRRLSDYSDAKVFVYIGTTLIKTYYVPRGRTGNTWIVFMVDEKGEIHDINQFMDSTSWKNVGVKLAEFRDRDEIKSGIVVSPMDVKRSKMVNRQGEKAYHRKDLEGSVLLYQEAIGLDPNNGQAYSNLGLSFQKLNRTAEAIWANRKAIALAHGGKKHIVQASSYYNIARIYERQGKWSDALQNFKWALDRREHRAYRKGIARMQNNIQRANQ